MKEKIGISFSSNYLKQGSNEEKCKLASKNKISNISLSVREDKKEFDISNDRKNYNGNLIYFLPSVSYNLNNIKTIEEMVLKLINNKINTFIINPTNMLVSDYEWSTKSEQNKNFKNITESIAFLASNKIIVSLENPIDTKLKVYFGHNIEQMSDIIIYSRKILVTKYKFSENDANKYIRLCLNTSKMKQEDIVTWLSTFKESINIIKVKNNNYSFVINYIKTNDFKNITILYNTSTDLEYIIDEYNDFAILFGVDKNITHKKKINKNKIDYPSIIQKCIVIITILIALLMIYVRFNA